MGSESNLANHFAVFMGESHGTIKDILDLDFPKSLPKFEDKYAGLIPRALEVLRKDSEDLAETNRIFESLKAKYERERTVPSTSSKSKNGKKFEYRERLSPYSTGSSTPMRSPPMNQPNHDVLCSSMQSKTCRICEKLFASRQSLRRHFQRKHPEIDFDTQADELPPPPAVDLPYKCPTCSKGFDKLEVLALHQKRHQPKSLECPHCHRRYAFKNEFRKHLTRVHKIDHDEIPEDLFSYGQLTSEGEKYEYVTVGRPIGSTSTSTKDHGKENHETTITSSKEKANEIHDLELSGDEDDLDDMLLDKLNGKEPVNESEVKDVDDMLIQQLNNKEDKKLEDVPEDDEEDNEDLDDLLLQKLNS